ncbi:MAG: DivIVA domain-containing protein [Desulfobacterales bacterium]|jgi:cell division initiation protein
MVNLTPLDIQQQKFKTRFRGFDIQEVDFFLDQMADAFESLLKQNEKLKEEFRRLQLEIQGYKNREDAFKRALLNSQRVIEQMKENAQKSAELIVAEAEVKAEKILNKAHNRLAQLHEDIAELKRQRMQIEVQIGSVIEAHGKLLEISKEGMKAMDDEDSKIKLLQQNKA